MGRTAEIRLDAEEVKKILIDHFFRNEGIKVSSVELVCENEYEDRPCSTPIPVFRSVVLQADLGPLKVRDVTPLNPVPKGFDGDCG